MVGPAVAQRDDSPNGIEQDKRKRKIGSKKSTFKPQPVQLPKSSDTPPEEDQDQNQIHLPPPPSERKIARRRSSTRAIRERQHQSPSPPPTSKRQKTTLMNTNINANASSSQYPLGLGASVSGQRLPSPEHTISNPNPTPKWGSQSVMGQTEGFVRKTRKSMASFQVETSVDELVPLAESETPMIRKNKGLREAQLRRSSLGMRGQRANSSLGRGDLSVPHPSVDPAMFYTHISSTVPEPIRARHLLVFCVERAARAELEPPKSKSKKTRKTDTARTEEGDKLLSAIMDDFSKHLGQAGIDTNVFGSGGPSTGGGVPLRPHPKNVANREYKQAENAVIRRCKEECNEWARLLVNARNTRSSTISQLEKKVKLDKDPDLSPGAGVEGWMVDALRLAEEVIESGEGDLLEMGDFHDVEYKIDTLQQSTHAALHFTNSSTRFLDGIFTSLNNDLRTRERIGLPSTSTTTTDESDALSLLNPSTRGSGKGKGKKRDPGQDPIHMLRALASAESKVSEEVMVAAASVPSVSLSAMTPRRTAATPRRLGHTPRRTEKMAE